MLCKKLDMLCQIRPNMYCNVFLMLGYLIFFSFFLGVWIPNLITGLGESQWRVSNLGPNGAFWPDDFSKKTPISLWNDVPWWRRAPRRRWNDWWQIWYSVLWSTGSCILSSVWKLATSVLAFTILWTSISVFYVKTARDVVTVLLIFAKYLSLYLPIFTCTYRGTHTQAHMYNQHTRGMATTRHRSLV